MQYLWPYCVSTSAHSYSPCSTACSTVSKKRLLSLDLNQTRYSGAQGWVPIPRSRSTIYCPTARSSKSQSRPAVSNLISNSVRIWPISPVSKYSFDSFIAILYPARQLSFDGNSRRAGLPGLPATSLPGQPAGCRYRLLGTTPGLALDLPGLSPACPQGHSWSQRQAVLGPLLESARVTPGGAPVVNYAPIKKVSRSRTHDFFIFYLVPPGTGTASGLICPFIGLLDSPRYGNRLGTNLPFYLVRGISPGTRALPG